MKKLLLLCLFSLNLFAKTITPNDVHTLSVLIQDHIHFLLEYYDIEHKHDEILKENKILSTKLKPRNTWQKTHEILVKINMQRALHNLSRIEPVGIEASLNLHPDMVYEMNVRILAELKILEIRNDIKMPDFVHKTFNNKTHLDNYNIFVDISMAFDELNRQFLTPNYVFAEVMRIYEDITIILNHLKIRDTSLPKSVIKGAKPKDAFLTSLKVLSSIERLQSQVGIETIDFSEFKKEKITPNDVYVLTGLIISELQPIKAYIGLHQSITPPAKIFTGKKPENVEQLMQWNLKRLELIKKINRGMK